jgi:signal transduction histidine kinase
MRHSCDRMSELIANILDFARGRLGEGIQISPCPVTDLGEALTRVVAEVQATHPASIIECELAIAAPVVCDRARILQLFANLLVNAVTHGASDQPVRVQGRLLQGRLEVSVVNGGPAIAQERLQHLFEPFARGEQGRSVSGLGLGLYIARQIAQAHGGTLEVESSETHRTSFVFRLPIGGVEIGGVDMGDRSAGSAADPGPPPASREVQSRNAFADVAARCAR